MTVNNLVKEYEPHQKDFISNDIESLSISVSNSVLCILENSFSFMSLEWLKWEEFEFRLLTIINNLRDRWYEFDKVDLSWILSMDTKRELSNIISLNYPILEISRLLPWEKVVNIQFVWVKDLNDNISKEFTDLFVWKLKEKLIGDFDYSVKDIGLNWRLIRSNYKHLTFSFDAVKTINSLIFYNYIWINELILEIFNDIWDEELLNVSNWLDRNKIEEILLNNFLLSTWSWIVKQNRENSKMVGFYEAEMSSRDEKYNKMKCFTEKTHNLRKIRYFALKLKRIENQVFEQYAFQIFTIDNTDFQVVLEDSDWNKKINEILLRSVRKWKKVIPKKLELLLMQYLTFLNDGFDFISPSLTSNVDRDEIDNINNNIRTGIVDVKYIEKNYKWTYTRNALESYSFWKEWINIFIDIVDMWIMNINDFKAIANNVSTLIEKESIYSELLSTWNSVTKKFIDYVFSILDKYENVKIALWWDEIFLFIEWESMDKNEIDYLSTSLKKKWLKWRIALSTINNTVEWKDDNRDNRIFDILDNFTSINKIFETKIEKLMSQYSLDRHVKIPNNTILTVSDQNYEILNNNYASFLEKLEENLFDALIIWFLKFKPKRALVYDFEWVKVYIEMEWDSLKIII